MIAAEIVIKILLFHLCAIWWARHDSLIQDKAHRAKSDIGKLFQSNKANKLILSLGIGTDKITRVWLRGLMIFALSFAHLDHNYYTVVTFIGFSLMWIPVFNPLLASMRRYNDDSPELGDSGIDKWFQKRPTLYLVTKIVAYIVGLAAVIFAHLSI